MCSSATDLRSVYSIYRRASEEISVDIATNIFFLLIMLEISNSFRNFCKISSKMECPSKMIRNIIMCRNFVIVDLFWK